MFELIRVNENDKKILENLLEYYLYDFNMYYEDDLNDNGRFEFIDVKPSKGKVLLNPPHGGPHLERDGGFCHY